MNLNSLFLKTLEFGMMFLIFQSMMFSQCAGIVHPIKLGGDVSMSVIEITTSKVVVNINNGTSQSIFVNQQLVNNSTPGILGARISCVTNGIETHHEGSSDASLPLLPIDSGEQRELTVLIFKPIPPNAKSCTLSTKYLNNSTAVDLIYKATQSPKEFTPEDDEFIVKSERSLSSEIPTQPIP